MPGRFDAERKKRVSEAAKVLAGGDDGKTLAAFAEIMFEHAAGEDLLEFPAATLAASVELRPDLAASSSGVEPRQVDGFFVYSARLDGHPKWRGVERLQIARLEPNVAPGEFAIRLFNVVRER